MEDNTQIVPTVGNELAIKFETVLGSIQAECLDNIQAWCEAKVLSKGTLEVTEENYKERYDQRTDLNKAWDTLETERKSLKKTWNAPYEAFEKQYKEKTQILKNAIDVLSDGIHVVEEKQESARKTFIDDLIKKDADDIRRGLSEFVQNSESLWNKVCKPSYYNKKGSQVKNQEEWRRDLLGISRDLDVIAESEDKEMLTQAYIRTADLAASMQEVASAKRIRKAMAEPEPVKEPTVEEVEEVDEEPSGTSITMQIPDEFTLNDDQKKTAAATRRYTGPKYKLYILFEFAEKLGLTYEKVTK